MQKTENCKFCNTSSSRSAFTEYTCMEQTGKFNNRFEPFQNKIKQKWYKTTIPEDRILKRTDSYLWFVSHSRLKSHIWSESIILLIYFIRIEFKICGLFLQFPIHPIRQCIETLIQTIQKLWTTSSIQFRTQTIYVMSLFKSIKLLVEGIRIWIAPWSPSKYPVLKVISRLKWVFFLVIIIVIICLKIQDMKNRVLRW